MSKETTMFESTEEFLIALLTALAVALAVALILTAVALHPGTLGNLGP